MSIWNILGMAKKPPAPPPLGPFEAMKIENGGLWAIHETAQQASNGTIAVTGNFVTYHEGIRWAVVRQYEMSPSMEASRNQAALSVASEFNALVEAERQNNTQINQINAIRHNYTNDFANQGAQFFPSLNGAITEQRQYSVTGIYVTDIRADRINHGFAGSGAALAMREVEENDKLIAWYDAL